MRKVVGIVQARMNSSRLPGKMGFLLRGYPLLYWVLTRAANSRLMDCLVLATTNCACDDQLVGIAHECHTTSFRGDEDDVLERFVEAGRKKRADYIVRICGDNPLIAPEEIDRLIKTYITALDDGADSQRLYCFNHVPELNNSYPDGLGAEMFSMDMLEALATVAKEKNHREHVNEYIWDHKEQFDIRTVCAPDAVAGPSIKLDVDTEEDYEKIRCLCESVMIESTAADVVRCYNAMFHVKC